MCVHMYVRTMYTLHCMLQANEKNSKRVITFLLKTSGKYDIKVISVMQVLLLG